jgi:DNA-binding SARP family transcriptional activator
LSTYTPLTSILESSKPLLILHPSYRNRYRLLPELLAQRAAPIYLLVQEQGTTWQQLWQLLAQALSEQAGVVLPELPADISAEAAAKHLCSLLAEQPPHIIIIDAIDNLQRASCNAFLTALTDYLPAQNKIVLIGRAWLPDLVAVKAHAVCYPISEAAMLFDYADLPADGGRLLEVYAQGNGRVLVDGAEIGAWEGQLPRALFYFFVDRGIVTRDEIFQSFWPELSEREATNVFHVTKRKVHALLGFNLMVYQNGYYRIAPEIDLRYDVTLFLTQIQQSEIAETEEAIALLENAVRLYRQDFLVGLNAEWINARRVALRNQLAEAFGALGRLYERAERHIQAISAYERALAIQPYREDWARSLINLYIVYRQARRGMVVFERLECAVQKQTGKVKLDKRTQELVAKLRRLR